MDLAVHQVGWDDHIIQGIGGVNSLRRRGNDRVPHLDEVLRSKINGCDKHRQYIQRVTMTFGRLKSRTKWFG